jgi:peptidoglycan/LPS O-acetylase OafA/YrhL
MRSSNLAYQPRIDHLRCLAASLVFFFHVFHFYYLNWHPAPERPWLGLVVEGHTGVGLFFTLSGYLFMLIALQGEAIDYWRFIRNRFLRIFPLFLTVFAVAISVGRNEFRPADVLYVFFSNLGAAPTSNSFITGAAWTISIEFTFYLVFPFLARFAVEGGPRYLFRLLLLLLLFKVGAYGVSERSTHMFYSTLIGRFDQFVVGMLAAQLYQEYGGWVARHRGLMWVSALAVPLNSAIQSHFASYFLPDPNQPFWITWSLQESIGWALLIVAYQAGAPRWPQWVERKLRRGGEISFSFYLLHGLVIFTVFRWVGPFAPTGRVFFDGLLNAAVLYSLCWLAASLSYETIERPFLGLRKRYVKGAGPAR